MDAMFFLLPSGSESYLVDFAGFSIVSYLREAERIVDPQSAILFLFF